MPEGTFAVNGVKGRYVRFRSQGSTARALNPVIAADVYGKP